MTEAIADYNARLFRGGIYGRHHAARFHWLRDAVGSLGLRRASVLELGCFDARSVDYLPLEIERYVGLDAGWESGVRDGMAYGLDAARERHAADPRFHFLRSTSPEDIADLEGSFELGLCLETFEHIEPALVDRYLAVLAEKVSVCLLVTVPNEKGFSLLAKTLGAKLLGVDRSSRYSPREFFHALRGRMDRVPRDEHKGFDYAQLGRQIGRHFRQVAIAGVRPKILPSRWRPTIGIVASHSPRHWDKLEAGDGTADATSSN